MQNPLQIHTRMLWITAFTAVAFPYYTGENCVNLMRDEDSVDSATERCGASNT
jgi:hypothetical protein